MFLYCSYTIFAQSGINLVPNSGFDELDSCPYNSGQADWLKYWRVANWSSPDIFTPCCTNPQACGFPNTFAGDQTPVSGDSYLGLCYHGDSNLTRYYRESIYTNLLHTLDPGKKYIAGFQINLADSSSYIINSIKLYFSDEIYYDSTDIFSQWNPLLENEFNLSFDISELTDTIEWVSMCKYFTGINKSMICLGNNIHNDSIGYSQIYPPGQWINLAYYYFENVFVREIEDVSIIAPFYFCNQLIHLSAQNAEEYRWYKYPDSTTIIGTEAELEINSQDGDIYIVQGRLCDYISRDTITVNIVPDCVDAYATITSGSLQLSFNYHGANTGQLFLYNNLGQVVFYDSHYSSNELVYLSILADGNYYYQLVVKDEAKLHGKLLYKK